MSDQTLTPEFLSAHPYPEIFSIIEVPSRCMTDHLKVETYCKTQTQETVQTTIPNDDDDDED